MFSHKSNLLKLCSVCALAAFLFLQSCRKEEPASAADNPTGDKTTESDTRKIEYANDLDRLGQLTNRINGACGGSYVVVLGADDPAGSSGPVSVDYGLFDKLSDDGAAVLIAEAIAARYKTPLQTQRPLAEQTKTNITRIVLQADEVVGRYIARAGFSPDGFAEWLRAKRDSAAGLQKTKDIPEKVRIAAFMRGYSSERHVKGR